MQISRIAFLAAMLSTSVAAGPDQTRTDTQKDGKDGQAEADKSTPSMSQKARLGVTVMVLNSELRSFFGAPKDCGLLVAQVVPDSPADHAGIRVGDVITKLGAHKVDNPRDILSAVSRLESPQQVSIELVRDQKTVTVRAVVSGRRESSEPRS